MQVNRDELLLLSRGGRVPRARPDPGDVRTGSGRPRGRASGTAGSARAAVRARLAGFPAAVADALRTGVAMDGRQGPRPVAPAPVRHQTAPTLGDRDMAPGEPSAVTAESYVQLEFAVGFTAEDEPWL